MSQTIGIILRFREDQADTFESHFQEQVFPLWQAFKAQGKFIAASLSRVEGGDQEKAGIQDYILHVEVPGMAEHKEFDSHPQFVEFLPKALAMQPEEPLVWFGQTLFQV